MQRRAAGLTNVLSLMGAFLAASVVLGLLAAGIAIPLVGGAGVTTKAAVGTFDALPAELTTPVLAQQTRILASDGKTELARLFTENRTVVPLSRVAPVMRKAQLAIEDDRFYEHGGIDTRGLARAIVSNAQGNLQGASTITQQYVKQSLITTALHNNDEQAAQAAQEQRGIPGLVRKLQEAKFAIELEKKMSKNEILEGYLNLIFYGANAYGVEAAANRYFGVSAKSLNLPQAAMIAGLAQMPDTYNPMPGRNPEGALKRRNTVLDRMAAVGAATPAEVAAAKKTPLGLNPQPIRNNCSAATDKWVCLYVQKWLEKNATSLGKDESERSARLLRGGLTITTTLDARLINETRKVLTGWIPPSMEASLGTAAAVVEPGTGKVLAIGQSSKPSTDLIWSVDKQYGDSGGFPIGSTAKTYAVATALKKGMTGESTVFATRDGTVYDQSRFNADDCNAQGGPWPVSNVEGTIGGRMSLRSATVWSVNTAFADLATKIGVCDTKALMKEMGLHRSDGKEYGDFSPAIVLGANEASPLTMAASYATLAAGGTYCEPYPIAKITTYDGTVLETPQPKCHQTSLSPRVAYDTTRILRGVVPPNDLADNRDAAAKTGTSEHNAHTWMVGYTPQRATAVWSGRPNSTEGNTGVRLGDRWISPVYGSSLSGPSWKKIMDAASAGLPEERFRIMPLKASADGKITLPDLRGSSEEEARDALQGVGLKVQVSEQRANEEDMQWGQVVRTDPAAGTQVDNGATVTLTLATGWWPGQAPARQDPPPSRNTPSPTKTRSAEPRTRAQPPGQQRKPQTPPKPD